MAFGVGWQEILIILLIVIILFGARRIPDLAKGLGKSVKEFKRGIRGIESPGDEEKKDKKD